MGEWGSPHLTLLKYDPQDLSKNTRNLFKKGVFTSICNSLKGVAQCIRLIQFWQQLIGQIQTPFNMEICVSYVIEGTQNIVQSYDWFPL